MNTPSPVPAPRTMMMIGPPPHRSPCPVEQVEDDLQQEHLNKTTLKQNRNEFENESSGVSSAKSDDTPQFSHQVI